MQPPISEATKRAVIEEYLRGKSRDQIAIDLAIGTGTVSKTIIQWKAGLPNADELRELVILLRKLGISASRYAEGARIASCLINLGVNDEDFHQFVSVAYDRCKKMDLQPDKLAYLLKQLLDLSESIPVAQIPEYIEQQRSQVQKSKEEIKKLDAEICDRKIDLCIVLDEENTTRDELDQFSSLKAAMDKNGVAMFDNSKFVEALVGAKQLGFDPKAIVEKASNLAKIETHKKELEERVQFLEKRWNDLDSKCRDLEAEELVHTHTLSIYDALEGIGMGIKKLKLLHHTVEEIATANNISKESASQKFLSDVEQQYDDKLGFESKLMGLKSEINILQNKLVEKNQVAKALSELILMGFNDEQILNLAWALQSNTGNKESLEADLKRYGSLKKSIEELNQEITILQSKKEQIEPRVPLDLSKVANIWQMQLYNPIAPFVEANIGKKIEASTSTLDLDTRSPDASYTIKEVTAPDAKMMINKDAMDKDAE